MKRFLFGFLAVLFLILNTIPYLHIFADDMPTNSQYEMLGAYALSTLITSGEATELDFSDYTENDTSFLIDLGEAIFTGDWSGLAEDGLEWLGETADNIYDSYKEYVSQWKYDHLGIMYSNWFPDEQIRVGPDDSYSLAKPLRELFTPRSDNNSNIDPDFYFITNINTFLLSDNDITYNFFNYSTASNYPWGNTSTLSPMNFSYYAWGSDNESNFIQAHNQGAESIKILSYTPLMTINIDSSNPNQVIISYSNASNGQLFSGQGNGYYNIWVDNGILIQQNFGNQAYTLQTVFSGLSSALNYLYAHFCNVNLYVNGEPWVLINSSTNLPIVIPGQLTIYNNQPLEYSFPPDTHIDLPDLTNIIRNAINSSGVVMWSDIADTYVDVNGQTAVAVTKIVRNDYDNLYMEQYPYPAMLVGMTDQTKFNEHLLDNSHVYLSPMGTVVQETVNVLPSEIVGVLAIGAILTIFSVIINRLLE